MDYHSLPRKQLQALCKKHGIPANAANSEMADALTTLLKPKPQPQPQNSKLPEKRATRSSEPALSETVSKTDDLEEGLNMKPDKATNTHKILELKSNKEPQRTTRGRGSASTVSDAPKSAASKTAKTPTASEMETISTTKQQEVKKVHTRNGGNKQSNSEIPTSAEENVDAKTLSPSDKKKEKAGGIVLRRGRVKVRSPRNLSKTPESAQFTEEVAVTTKKNGVEMPCSQSCLVDAKKTRKKKRSVTFSDVIEVNSASIKHSTGVDVSKNIEEPAKEAMAEIQQSTESNLPKNLSMAKKVISTRKTSRSVSTEVIAAQADHQKISKQPSKAKESRALKAEKTANIEIGGKADRKRAARGKKAANTVSDAAAKENKEVMVADSFVKDDLVEAIPCARRSRRLTIVPADVKCNHDMQLVTEQLKGQSKDDHVSVSKKTEGDLPAETSRRSRRKTLAPLELNHVQSTVGSASQQMEQKVAKAEIAHSKSFSLEMTDDALELQQKQSELKTCNSILVANEADIQPIKSEETLSVRNLRGSRQKASVTSTYQHITPAKEVSIEKGNLTENVNTTELEEVHSKAARSTSILANSEQDSLQEVSNDAKAKGARAKSISVIPRSTRKTSAVAAQPDNETPVSQEPAFSTQKQEDLEIVDEALGKVSNDAKAKGKTTKTISLMPRSTRKTSNKAAQSDNETLVSQEQAYSTLKREGLQIEDKAASKNIQDSEDLGIIAQVHHDQSQEILLLRNIHVPRVEEHVSTPSKKDINHRDSFSCAFEVVIGEGDKGQNQTSDDADSISCNKEFEHDTCSIDVSSSNMTAIHCVASDSETANTSPLVDIHSIKPDATTAVKDQVFTEETSSATLPEHVLSRHKFSAEKDQVIEQETNAMDESAPIISLTKDIKDTITSNSTVSGKIQDEGSIAGNPHMHGITLESSKENYTNYTNKDSLANSPRGTEEPATEISVDIATAEHEACTFKVHLLTSGNDKIVSMTCGGAEDLIEQQPDQVEDLKLCEGEDAVKKLKIEVYDDLQKVDHVAKVSKDAKAKGETASNASALQDNGTPFSLEPAFTTQKQEGLEIVDETVDKNFQDSEISVIAQAHHKQSLEILVLENTNVPRVEEPVNSTASTEDINCDRFSCAFQAVIGEGGEGQNQISEDADSISCNEDFEHNLDPHSIKPDAVVAINKQEFPEEVSSATSPVHVLSRQESHAINESAGIISLTKDMKDTFRSDSPVSTKIQDKHSLDTNLHVYEIESENGLENYTDKISSGRSPSAPVESAAKISVDIASPEHEACTHKAHLLTSDKDKIGRMTSGRVAELIEQQPDQVVDLNLCDGEDAVDKVEMEVHDDLQKELQNIDDGVPYDGVKSVYNRSAENDQLSPRLPSCSVEPGTTIMPMESACKTKQKRPRAIYMSARKAQFSVPWEITSPEANTASHSNKEASLSSLDQEEKNAEIWGLNNHEMSSDGIESASSEDEGSSADTEETLSDTEDCNFETEMLIPNVEGDYSCSEDDTPSDSENDTIFDSDESFSEMEGEPLSGDENEEQETSEGELSEIEEPLSGDENEEQETSEEELSESEDDVEDELEEYEASPVSQTVAISESIDALYTTGGLEEEQVEIIVAPVASLSNDEFKQAEIINHMALEHDVQDEFEEYQASPESQPVAISESIHALYTTGGLEKEQVEIIAASESSLPNDGVKQAVIMNHLVLEKDVQAEFEAFDASLVSQPVTISERIDALYINGGLEEEQVEIVTASESSLPNDGVTQAEIINHLALENDVQGEFEAYEASPVSQPVAIYSTSGLEEDEVEIVAASESSLLNDGVTQAEIINHSDLALEYDVQGEFEAYEASPVSQPVAISERIGALYHIGGLEEEQVEIVAVSESSLPNDGVMQTEIINHLAFENDVQDEFEEYEASPVSQSVPISEGIDALYITGGLEEEQVDIIAASESSLPNNGDGVTQAEIINHLAFENDVQGEFEAFENDVQDEFEEYEASPMSQPVATSEGIDAPYITGGLEEEQVDIIAASESSLSNNGDEVTQAEIINHLAFENDVQDEYEEYEASPVSQPVAISEGIDAPYITGGMEEGQGDIIAASELSLPNHGDGLTQAEIINHLALENDVQDEFEEYEASPVSQPVAISEGIDAPYITGGLEEEQGDIIAATELSLPNHGDGLTQAEIINHLALENDVQDEFEEYKASPVSQPVAISEGIRALYITCGLDEEQLEILASSEASLPNDGDGVTQAEIINHLALENDVQDEFEEFEASELSQPVAISNGIDALYITGGLEEEQVEILAASEASLPNDGDGVMQAEIIHHLAFENDVQDEFEEFEASPVSQPVAISESIGALFSTGGLEEEEVEIIAASESSLSNSGVMQAEIINHLAFENDSKGCSPNVEPTDNNEKFGVQHEEMPKHAVTEIQRNEDVVMPPIDNTSIERMQSATTTTCHNSESFGSLSFLAASPPTKALEDVCSLSLAPSGILESAIICQSIEDKEIQAAHNVVHEITKEESMKQIDLTLLSVRNLRQMCKGNLMSAKKKTENKTKKETENETPAKTPSRLWMSATKQVQQFNTSTHQRDFPSANKRSALKALSSNIKASSSAAMQTPTAKGSQRPQNLMSAYDGNDGTGKHLVTPSPQAPMSSKRDFARSHHR